MARNHLSVALAEGIEAGAEEYFKTLGRFHPEKLSEWPKTRPARLRRYEARFGEQLQARKIQQDTPAGGRGTVKTEEVDLSMLKDLMERLINQQPPQEQDQEYQVEPESPAEPETKRSPGTLGDEVSISRGLTYWFLYRGAEAGYKHVEVPISYEEASEIRGKSENPYLDGTLKGSK